MAVTNKKKGRTPAGASKPGPNLGNKHLPATFLSFVEKFPRLGQLHEEIGKAVDDLGPLDRKTCALIKIGICAGSRQESALKSHVRRALREGATVAEIEQTIMLAMNTCGFPTTVAAWRWALEQLNREKL